MTTFTDQSIPKNTWTEVTGLVNAQSYALQDKSIEVDMFVIEAAISPTGFGKGRVIRSLRTYNFTKGTDGVFVFFSGKDGLISVNEGT